MTIKKDKKSENDRNLVESEEHPSSKSNHLVYSGGTYILKDDFDKLPDNNETYYCFTSLYDLSINQKKIVLNKCTSLKHGDSKLFDHYYTKDCNDIKEPRRKKIQSQKFNSDTKKDLIGVETSINNYKKLGLEIEELENNTVKITQKRIINGYILNRKDLVDRAKEIFPKSKILPIRYSLDVADISSKWIQDKMKEFGVNTNDLVSQVALDKSSLSLFLSGERKMNKSVKALFFYYFLTYELNRDFREYINIDI